ncbi:MAG: prepilin-type N-terminal cleavage/methylation domain-containing protein [Bacteroidales bacterium]|nr:prepilin-type N-terminal cleavage/methylation domain-containing protein [Bacteroidales bacterium]
MDDRKKTRLDYHHGFTLIELIIVLALLAFLFSSSLPSLAGLRSSLIGKTVVQKISSQLRIAKIEALNQGKTTKIVFNTTQNEYIYTDSSGKSTHYELPDEVILYRTNFPLNTIRFYLTGTPSSGGTITLRIGNNLKYLIITPVTGRVRISDKPPSN